MMYDCRRESPPAVSSSHTTAFILLNFPNRPAYTSEKGLVSLVSLVYLVFWLIETNQTNQINQITVFLRWRAFLASCLLAHMPSFLWGSGPKSLRFRPIIVALP